MSKKKRSEPVSIRIRLDEDILANIDKIAGDRGRQRFIIDAIQWRLNEEIPPIVLELSEELELLKKRVRQLEQTKTATVFYGSLNEVTKNEICSDDLDRKLLIFFIENEGGTTPELATDILGDSKKRRTVLDRIDRINKRALKLIGTPLLEYKKGFVKDKRGAWWLVDPPSITE
ncbi:MAG: hypothetical protein RTV72_00250 [Candidatus Thorarchaeota archaeon]